MTLADTVLPLVRNRSALHRWSAANSYGYDVHEAARLLREAAAKEPAGEVLAVTQKAIASACKGIMRADDSSGIIGGAIRDLLALHAELARTASPPWRKLVDWLIRFQFANDCDFFEIDPVAYGPALGEQGLAAYRAKLDEIRAGLGPEPTPEEERALWGTSGADHVAWERAAEERHQRFVLGWNDRRLAVSDRDVEAIIATHARDRRVAAWFEDTAEALAEIGQIDLAIDWARQATYFGLGHQSVKAAGYWCALLAEHRPDEELPARLEVFRRWPTSTHAGGLRRASGAEWPDYREEVMATLERSPREAVSFALHGLDDAALAWRLAHELDLDEVGLWGEVVTRYEKVDPLAVLPIHADLARGDLERADARAYKSAARRLARMRKLAAGSAQAEDVDELVAELRETHRRRPRLQQEFTRAGLP